MDWAEFAQAAPDIARCAEERMAQTGLVLLGTLRADGWPRISPIEPLILNGQLVIGGTRGTRKTVDLTRDPRCVVNTLVTDKDGTEGEVKLVGTAHEITDADMLERLADDALKRYNFRPPAKTYHQFRMDITSAAHLIYHADLTNTISTWRAGESISETNRRWTTDGYKIVTRSD